MRQVQLLQIHGEPHQNNRLQCGGLVGHDVGINRYELDLGDLRHIPEITRLTPNGGRRIHICNRRDRQVIASSHNSLRFKHRSGRPDRARNRQQKQRPALVIGGLIQHTRALERWWRLRSLLYHIHLGQDGRCDLFQTGHDLHEGILNRAHARLGRFKAGLGEPICCTSNTNVIVFQQSYHPTNPSQNLEGPLQARCQAGCCLT